MRAGGGEMKTNLVGAKPKDAFYVGGRGENGYVQKSRYRPHELRGDG